MEKNLQDPPPPKTGLKKEHEAVMGHAIIVALEE